MADQLPAGLGTPDTWLLLLATLARGSGCIASAEERVELVETGVIRRLQVGFDFSRLKPALTGAPIYLPMLVPRRHQRLRVIEVESSAGTTARVLPRTQASKISSVLRTTAAEHLDDNSLSQYLDDFRLLLVEVRIPPRWLEAAQYSLDVSIVYEPPFTSHTEAGLSRIRPLLGFKPFVFRIECPAAHQALDYQLEVVGPQDHYVRYSAFVTAIAQAKSGPIESFVDVEGRTQTVEPSKQHEERSTRNQKYDLRPLASAEGVYVSPPSTSDSSAAVLDASGGTDFDSVPLSALVVFNERSPGTLSRAGLLGTLCAAALFVAWASYDWILQQAGIAAETVVLLLGLPGTLAFWVRPSRSRTSTVDPPTSARFAVFMAGSLSFVGAILLFRADARYSGCGAHDCGKPTDVYMGKADAPWGFHLGDMFVGPSLRSALFVCALGAALAALYVWIRAIRSSTLYRKARSGDTPGSLPAGVIGKTMPARGSVS